MPADILGTTPTTGKWEGTITRVRNNGGRFPARVVITPRRDSTGKAIADLLISKDISAEIRLTEELKFAQFYGRSLVIAPPRKALCAGLRYVSLQAGRPH